MKENKIDKMAQEYKDELDVLDEIRAENALRFEGLSEEDFIKQLAEDYEAIYKDAIPGYQVTLFDGFFPKFILCMD